MIIIETLPERVIYKVEYLSTVTGKAWLSVAHFETPEEAEVAGREVAKDFAVSAFNRVVKFTEDAVSTPREQSIYSKGFRDGMGVKADQVQPTIHDLEIRLSTATDLLRNAIAALNTPSF
jgi:hypothetical protein